MKKRLVQMLTVFIALAVCMLPVRFSQAVSVTTGMIEGDQVALRSSPSTSGKLLTRMDEGTIVKVLETNVNSEWYHVQTTNRTGYVNRLYVNIDASLESYQLNYTGTIVNCETDVNVRAKASAGAKKIGVAQKGATYTVSQAYCAGAWHEIEFDGQTGYVSADYMELMASVGDEYLAGLDVTGGTLSPAFSPTEFGYVLTATESSVVIKASANSGVKVSIGSTGIASAKYTINSGNSKTIRISVNGKVRYSIYLVRDVLTVGTWNIKRGNDNLVMQGWLIAAQKPDILGVQKSISTRTKRRTTCSPYARGAPVTPRLPRRSPILPAGSTASARFRSSNRPETRK
jgi:uncharacterized protein YgiM (DUF1202 family)